MPLKTINIKHKGCLTWVIWSDTDIYVYPLFFSAMKVQSYSSKATASVEDRIKRNINSIQRTPAALESFLKWNLSPLLARRVIGCTEAALECKIDALMERFAASCGCVHYSLECWSGVENAVCTWTGLPAVCAVPQTRTNKYYEERKLEKALLSFDPRNLLGFRKEWSQHLCKRFLSSLITSTENHRLASVSLATQSRCLFYFSVAINLDKNLVPIRCGALDRFNGFVKQLNLAKWRLSPNTIYFDNFYEFVRQLNCNWAKWRFSPKLYI